MFDTKLEVDRHVESCLRKINNEAERNLRCFAFAKLYFKVGDYEQARRYVSTYLTVKPLSAEALNLLGKTLEKQGKREAAIDAYRKSLDIDPKQNSLVIKVCELLSSDEVSLDLTGAHYYCEKAQSFDPHNPVIFSLKERLVAAESRNPDDVSKLLLTELASRPTDVQLRVRLLRHFLQNNQIKEAYKHAFDIEQRHLPIFVNSLAWYEVVAEVLVRYQRENMLSANLTWEFWMLLVSVLDKLVALTLDERSNNIKNSSECVSVVFNFDQMLAIAGKGISSCNERPLVQEFLNHYKAQLCFHLATLLFKQAKRDLIKYKEAMQAALPLLFAAYHTQPAELHCMWMDHSPENLRQQMQRWHREAAFRCSQAGHIILSAAKDRKVTLIEKVMQGCSGLWREQLFKKLFVTRDQQAKMKSSYFVCCPQLVDIAVRLPEVGDVVKYDEIAELVYPDSLHHLVWICLNQKLATFKCTVFDGLMYSGKHLNNCAAESLNVLDIESFLYCTALTVQQQLEETKQQIYYNVDKPSVLPAAVTDQLGTVAQIKWLTAAYKMYRNDYGADMSELRLNLIRGIEVVRCVGNHGLDVKLLVILANTFAERAKSLTKQSEIEFNEARADLYWKAALPLLEKLQKNQVVTYAPNRLFEYKSKEMSPAEIQSHIDEGKLFNGTLLMKRKEHEKALHIFESLRSPYAMFHQAQIYKSMADEQVNQNKENVTSEMRSQHIILLSRARDCLYLTLDRLRDPSVDRKHPLNAQLGTEIEKIERLLSRIDPDVHNLRNECDGMSDENVSSAGSMGDHGNNLYSSTLGNSFYPSESLTPHFDRSLHLNRYRLELPTRREARPSPERLDAQLRQMQASRDATIGQVLEQNRAMVESHRSLVEELRSFRDAITNLTGTVDDLKTVKHSVNEELQNFRDLVQEMKKEISELKKDSSKQKSNQLSDEDLYVLDEEYAGDYAINSNVAGFNPSNLYQNYQGRLPGTNLTYPPPAALYPGLYPMYPYTNLGLPQAGALPFAQDAQIPDFRALSTLTQGLPQPAYAQSNLAQPALAQPKPAWDVGAVQPALSQLNQLGLIPPGMPLAQPQANIFRDNKLDSTGSTGTVAATSSAIFSSAKSAPVNVVITSSDPLPKTTVQTTQVLSVTIPPQHLKGNLPPKSQPHNYQIPLPATSAILSTTPTIINQPPLVVSTQGLLSNIAPPVYSAIDNTKSPSRNTGLGLQIEKSLLSQSFNTSTDKVDKTNVSSSSVDEHDPCPDFKPIIPLPDEVAVNTGEENEAVLFAERAKLFRFINKEWRERGIGTLKILQSKETGKVRILMRRDQVHKICANHFLSKDMALTPMPNMPRAYLWIANDYADEEIVLEKLCARFKTEEEAGAFYNAFEKAKSSLVEHSDSSSSASSLARDGDGECNVVKTTETTSLGGFIFTSTPTFKPKEQDFVPKVTVQPEIPCQPGQKAKPVKTPEPMSQTVTVPVRPGLMVQKSSPFASFTFGTKSIPSSTSSPVVTANIFSSPPTSVLEFKPVTASADTTTPQKCPQSATSPKTPVEEFEPTVDFQPVVPLPELVEIKTGEENSEILFESRAKLLRYDAASKEWKERGVGIIKLLKENTVRLLMRREQVHKVCCNHQLLRSMQFTRMSNNLKALTWYAQDYSEGVLKTEMFAIRFKLEEQADAFYKAVTCMQELLDENNMVTSDDKVVIPEIKADVKDDGRAKSKEDKKVKSSEPEKIKVETPKTADRHKPKLGSWECKNCFIVNDGKAHLCVACETPKSSTTPKKCTEASESQFSFGISPTSNDASNSSIAFGSPATVVSSPSTPSFSFGQKVYTPTLSWGDAFKPVEGAQQSLNDSKLQSDNVKKESASKTTSSSSWGDAFKPKSGSWECQQCLVRNDADKLYCLSCEHPKDDSVPKKEASKGINLDTPGLQFSFGMPAVGTPVPPSSAAASTTFGFNPQPATTFTFGTATTKPFTFVLPKDGEAEAKAKSREESQDQFVFGSPQKHAFEFTPRSPRRHSSGCQGDEESDSFVEDDGDHIYFKPVIPLPDKVDVKTGEEQEEMLYCHRAKLFRFVQGEWKERGIGDIKILLKIETGKLRVLMRRDQVLKICLNHILTPDIEYVPKDEKTWLFSAPDYSEGEINHWQFCLRFKTADVAQEFKRAVDGALKRTAEAAGTSDTLAPEDHSEVEFVSETTVTPEEEQEAIRLKLPPKFMAYRQLPDCSCETCKKDDVLLSQLLQDKPQPVTSIFGTRSLFGTPVAKNNLFGSADTGSRFVFGTPLKSPAPVPTTPPAPPVLTKSESLKDMLAKPSMLAGIAISKAPDTTLFSSPKSVFNLSTPLSEQKVDTSSSIKNFSFSLKTDAPTTPTTPADLFGSSTKSIFGVTTTVGSIFAGSTTPTGSLFDNTTSGTSVFSAPTATTSSIFSSVSTPTTMVSTGSLFGGFAPTPTATSGCIFGGPASNLFGPTTTSIFGTPQTSTGNIFGASKNKSESDKALFGSTAPTFGAPTDNAVSFGSLAAKTELVKPDEAKKEQEIVLKCDSNLSFATLAAATPSTPVFGKTSPDDEKPFAFLGRGSLVFSSLQKQSKSSPKKKEKDKDKKAHSGDEAEGSDAEAAEDYDPHYEPIVPLPDAIVVSTGEEEEQILFNERAKLYRYDSQTKEWKERGVGQMKILHHPINGTYRFLLRREQVHKVVLNMLIMASTELQPMTMSDKAWLWCGYNYSDDEAAPEKLAARFKNCDLAHQFYTVVQQVIATVVEQQSKLPSIVQEFGLNDEQDGDGTVESAEGHEEDDDVDEDDRTIMFTKHCTLSEQLPTSDWQEVSSGELQVYYDPDIYGSRISVCDDTGLVISNTLIGINTEMVVENQSCVWKAVEWAEDNPQWRTLKASFDCQEAAEELHCNYLESIQFAHESDLVDGILENPDVED